MNIPNCIFCNTSIEMPQPLSMLLCDHVAHTHCMLRELTARARHARCPGCTNYLVPDEIIQEIQQYPLDISGVIIETASTRIIQLFTTNTQFKKDAKEIQQQALKALTAEKKAIKVRNQKRKEFMSSLADIKDMLNIRRQDMKQALKNSPEYKTYVREVNKLQILNKKLETTYNVPYRRLPTDLRDKRGFKTFPNIWRYASYLLRSARIRI
jgi:hypothetical protein